MLFHTSEFIFIFLPAAVALHFILARHSASAAIIATTVTSLAFYTWWRPPFVLLPVLSILANFWIARRIAGANDPAARRLLIAGIVANLAVLGWFKYADFVLSIFQGRKPAPAEVPLALSFTTFVQIAFLADVWRRRTRVEFAPYAMFVAFFPHLIAGPIVRWSDLGPQIADRLRYRVDWNNIALGLTIFTLGLAKKVLIADRLAPHVAPVFEAATNGEPLTAFAAWGAALRVFGAALFRFLRLFRHGGRPRPPVQPAPADQLRRAVPRDQHHRSVAALAHLAVALPARLRLRAARRRGARAGAAHLQPVRHHDARRAVARRELDLHRMGRVPRRAARDQSRVAHRARKARSRARSDASPDGSRPSSPS